MELATMKLAVYWAAILQSRRKTQDKSNQLGREIDSASQQPELDVQLI